MRRYPHQASHLYAESEAAETRSSRSPEDRGQSPCLLTLGEKPLSGKLNLKPDLPASPHRALRLQVPETKKGGQNTPAPVSDGKSYCQPESWHFPSTATYARCHWGG